MQRRRSTGAAPRRKRWPSGRSRTRRRISACAGRGTAARGRAPARTRRGSSAPGRRPPAAGRGPAARCSRENVSSRSSVSRDSSRNVGKIANVSASASCASAVAANVAVRVRDQRRAAGRCARSARRTPRRCSCTSRRQRLLLLVEHAEHVGAVARRTPDRLPSASFRSWPPPSRVIARRVLDPGAERLLASACRRSPRISSSSTVGSTCASARACSPSVELRRRRRARASAPRRSRRAASSGAGSPWCPRASARTSASIVSVDARRGAAPCRAPSSGPCRR